MVWFYCDDCGDSIKKPKLVGHFRCCAARSFTCIDCSRTFDRDSVQKHSTCVTEHEKYALGATKPGGYASQGYHGDGKPSAPPTAAAGEPTGLEFLTTRPPWKCTVCNVNCTSRETLEGHAAGAKHKRRARAALAAANGGANPSTSKPDEPTQPEVSNIAAAANSAAADAKASASNGQAEKKSDKATKKRAPSPSSSDSDSDESEKEEPPKKKDKKAAEARKAPAAAVSEKSDKKSKKSKKQQEEDDARLAPLLKAAGKKLKAKGSLTLKKLKMLITKKSGEEAGEEIVARVRELLTGSGAATFDGKALCHAA